MARQLISLDWAIKRLLRSKANFDVLEGFLSELLKEDIKIEELLESESNKRREAEKLTRVDLKVKNSKGELVIIEIQFDREIDYFHRLLYTASQVVVEHLEEGARYSEVKKVISISRVYFDLGHGQDYIYKGSMVFEGIHKKDKLELNESQKRL